MAGLLGGLLAGAIGGAGKAIQYNAQSSIEQKRQAALKQIDHDYAMKRQDDQQGFTTKERLATEKFKKGENRLDRQALNQRNQITATAPTANQREATWLMDNGLAPDLATAYDMATTRSGADTFYERGQDKLNYLQDRIDTIQKLRSSSQWMDVPEEEQKRYIDELSELQGQRRAAEDSVYSNGRRGLLGGQQPRATGGAGAQGAGISSREGGITADDYINRFIP